MQIFQSCQKKKSKFNSNDNNCRTQLFHTNRTLTAKDLIEKNFDVVGGEVLRRNDDLVQIALHQFGDHVSVAYKERKTCQVAYKAVNERIKLFILNKDVISSIPV